MQLPLWTFAHILGRRIVDLLGEEQHETINERVAWNRETERNREISSLLMVWRNWLKEKLQMFEKKFWKKHLYRPSGWRSKGTVHRAPASGCGRAAAKSRAWSRSARSWSWWSIGSHVHSWFSTETVLSHRYRLGLGCSWVGRRGSQWETWKEL